MAKDKVRRHQDEVYWGRPVPGFGDPAARLLIVGLAPGAHGSNRTGRMFTGDSSGDWLYEALHRFGFANQPTSRARDDGLRLIRCYITAAARCAPPDNKPTPRELDNCRPWLESELLVLPDVRVVVTLGRIALDAYAKAAGIAGKRVFSHGGETKLPSGIRLITSYHPSRQNTNTGKLTREMWYRIFGRARAIVKA